MSFVNNTPVSVNATQVEAIQQFKGGDPVYAADTSLNWTEGKVDATFGSAGGNPIPMVVFIRFKVGGQPTDLIATPDQLFFMQDKTLKTANTLTVGDLLTAYDGSAIEVIVVEMGQFDGGEYAISTDASPGVDGHLTLVKGVVCGDFALQMDPPGEV